jgi:hypothetical protein
MNIAEPASVDALVRPVRPKRSRRQPLQQTAADPIIEALHLLKRQARIRDDLRGRRGCYIVGERELLQIRNRLAQFPAAVQAITLTAAELQRPVDTLNIRDIEKRSGRPRAVTRDSLTHTANPR